MTGIVSPKRIIVLDSKPTDFQHRRIILNDDIKATKRIEIYSKSNDIVLDRSSALPLQDKKAKCHVSVLSHSVQYGSSWHQGKCHRGLKHLLFEAVFLAKILILADGTLYIDNISYDSYLLQKKTKQNKSHKNW